MLKTSASAQLQQSVIKKRLAAAFKQFIPSEHTQYPVSTNKDTTKA